MSAGEEPLISGLRELQEEIGINAKPENLDFYKIIKHQTIFNNLHDNEFYYVYLLKFDGDINKLKLQKEEVQEIKFLPVDKIREELKINFDKYVPHGDYWLEIFTKVKNKTA